MMMLCIYIVSYNRKSRSKKLIEQWVFETRTAEADRMKSEARLQRLREGGISVDEFIDKFVYTYEAEEKAEERAQEERQLQRQKSQKAAAEGDWGSSGSEGGGGGDQLQVVQVEQQPQYYQQQQQQQDANGGWAVDGWDSTEAAEAAAVEPQADGGNWASWDNQPQEEQPQAGQDDGGGGGEGGWASFEQQNTVIEAAPAATEYEASAAVADGGRTAAAFCLYDFESQGFTLMELAFKFHLNNSSCAMFMHAYFSPISSVTV